MRRLIDADALIGSSLETRVPEDFRDVKLGYAIAMEVIKRQPTIDAVQVIRCKDCKYAKKIYIKNLPWAKQWEYSCAYFNTYSVMGDGFCSWAEPKEPK